MPGLIKVGKTQHAPTDRAAELSRVTGVATPFIVAYEHYFDDCDAAEKFVHTKLDIEGHRTSTNREFFNAPLSDVIRAITEASYYPNAGERQILSSTDDASVLIHGNGDRDLRTSAPSEFEPWEEIFREAENHEHGRDGYIQDEEEAVRLYQMAAKLGAKQAYRRIGAIMEHGGHALKPDTKRAREYYKSGIHAGDWLCYAYLGNLFLLSKHYDNAQKCWNKFFDHFTHANDVSSGSLSDILMSICLAFIICDRRDVDLPALDRVDGSEKQELIGWFDRHCLEITKLYEQGKKSFEEVQSALDCYAALRVALRSELAPAADSGSGSELGYRPRVTPDHGKPGPLTEGIGKAQALLIAVALAVAPMVLGSMETSADRERAEEEAARRAQEQAVAIQNQAIKTCRDFSTGLASFPEAVRFAKEEKVTAFGDKLYIEGAMTAVDGAGTPSTMIYACVVRESDVTDITGTTLTTTETARYPGGSALIRGEAGRI